MFRVGLYARVSTHDQKTLPLQIRTMREYAAKREGAIRVPEESTSFSAGKEFLRGRNTDDIQSYYELVGNLASHNQTTDGDCVRAFANLTPAIVERWHKRWHK
jgi:hypothetical protein